MTPAIAVQRAKQTFRLDDCAKDHNQVIALTVLKPAMLAAIDMQQYACHRPPQLSSAMRSRACFD